MKSTPTTSIVLDTRRKKKNGTFPVKLRVTYQRKQKLYSPKQKISLNKEEFDKTQGQKPRGKFKDLAAEFWGIEKRARDTIKDLNGFSFAEFEKRHFTNTEELRDVFTAYDNYIAQLNKQGRAGTASNYECSKKSLKNFSNRKKLYFDELTPDYLRKYEDWMTSTGKSLTTVGIYLRPLRALFNEAIETGIVRHELYPFGKRKYQIPQPRNHKRALSLEEIGKIFQYQTDNYYTQRARDFFIFSYLCSGVNMKDIARLRYKNIQGDKIIFKRAKTENTTRNNLKSIVADMQPQMKDIIKRWGNKKEKDNYVFPILEEKLTPEQELDRVRNFTNNLNKHLKEIAKDLSLDEGLSTYWARHSFATILKQSGAPVALISEQLGHRDLKTTENYLGSFEDEVRRKFSEKLTNF